MSDDDFKCRWCGKAADEHGPPGVFPSGPFGSPTDRLCPTAGVTSQFYWPKCGFDRYAAIQAAQSFRKAKEWSVEATNKAFPLGCAVIATSGTSTFAGKVKYEATDNPDIVSVEMEGSGVWRFRIENVERVPTS